MGKGQALKTEAWDGFRLIKGTHCGAEDVLQIVEYLPCMPSALYHMEMVWRHMLRIPAFQRWRQEDRFKDRFSYIGDLRAMWSTPDSV